MGSSSASEGPGGTRRVIRSLLAMCVVANISVILMVNFQGYRSAAIQTAGSFDELVSLLVASTQSSAANVNDDFLVDDEAEAEAPSETTTARTTLAIEAAPEVQQQQQQKQPDAKEQTCEKRVLNNSEKSSLLFPHELDVFLRGPKANVDPSTPCMGLNTKTWMVGPRIGNAVDPLLTEEMVQHLILDIPFILTKDPSYATVADGERTSNQKNQTKAQEILGTSLCYDQSRFMQDSESATDVKSVRLWAVRLIYFALHYHQHRLAIPEVATRFTNTNAAGSACTNDDLWTSHGVGQFDYECGADAKYLVVPLSGNGLGANVRGSVVPALVMGLQLNRVVLFVNNSPVGGQYVKSSWPLVGCDRKDYQCFFMPTSPCTITHQDILGAYEMTKSEMRKFSKHATVPAGHEHDKVLLFYSPLQPVLKIPMAARERLSLYAHAMIDAIPCQARDADRVQAMRLGADLIRQDDAPRPGYNYAAAAEKIQHAAAFYFLRPKLEQVVKMEAILKIILPGDLDAERSVGLPIRASDKCKGESDCLSFDQHMQIVSSMWSRHQNATSDINILFTTESKAMVQEQKEFASNTTLRSEYPLSFNFVTNSEDVTPDTGFIKEVRDKNTADESMLSAVSSFKAQLLPRVSIGNCCSNFHVLLNDFLMEGCGAASDSTFMCLQEYDDPALRVCCGWHHDCKKAKKKFLDELQAKSAETAA